MVLHILSYNDETYRTWSGTILDYIFQGLIDVLNHFFRAVFVRMSKKKVLEKNGLTFYSPADIGYYMCFHPFHRQAGSSSDRYTSGVEEEGVWGGNTP